MKYSRYPFKPCYTTGLFLYSLKTEVIERYQWRQIGKSCVLFRKYLHDLIDDIKNILQS